MANEFIARNGLISQNNSVVTGSLTVTQGITGSLLGTASFAISSSRAVSSSFATTASYAPFTIPTLQQVTEAGNTTGEFVDFNNGINVNNSTINATNNTPAGYAINAYAEDGEGFGTAIRTIAAEYGIEATSANLFSGAGVKTDGYTGLIANGVQTGISSTGGDCGIYTNGGLVGVQAQSGDIAIYASGQNTGIYANGNDLSAGIFNIPAPNNSNIVEFRKDNVNQAYITHDGIVVSNKLLVNRTVGNGTDRLQVTGNGLFTGTLEVDTVNNGVGDFLTRTAGGIITRRTASEVRSDIGAQASLTDPITGTGANGQVAFWNGTNTQTGDNGLFWDNTSKRLGVGDTSTTSPQARLDVRAQGALSTDIAFRVRNSADTRNFLVVNGAGDVYSNGNTGVVSNIFYGWNVGRNVTTGIDNSFFGNDTGRATTTGYYNSFFGGSAGSFNTTGYLNVMYGWRSGYSNTSGNQNSFFGSMSGNNNTTGGGNTANGGSALANNTTGGGNTANGFQAGRFIADGTTALTISNNSVFLGSGTKALADNQTNQIVIGTNAIGLGSNTTVLGNASTLATAIYGNLLLGTTTNSTFRLDVNGTARLNGLTTIQGTTASDTAPLGAELLTTGTGDASWTGTSFATGYTHVVGSVTTLTSTLAAVISTLYQITYTVTGRTSGSFTIAFGGSSTAGITATGAVGPLASTTGTLVITPTTDFNGTIVLSIRTIGTATATTTFISSAGVVTNEIRVSNINSNTFIGLNAGRSNTTGSQNTALGRNALESNTTGNNNTANGFQALRSNTTGNSNTANGVSALQNNTTGGNNTANGVNALLVNTTGGNNTANGVYALFANTTGGDNTANGYYALQNNTTGGGNTANGVYALLSNTTGNNNTANGFNAGRFIADGVTSNTISNNSVFIGAGTRALANNQSNQIVIGTNAIGLGSNTTVLGNSSTTDTAIYGRLLSGTTTLIASAQVQIDSTTRGFLPPRMTNTQRLAIASPAVGLCVYCTDTVEGLYINKSTGWTFIG
jgi:hypothetical protein